MSHDALPPVLPPVPPAVLPAALPAGSLPWQSLLRSVAAGGERMVLQTGDGRRVVLLSERRYTELQDAAGHGAPRPRPTLTAREREVLSLVADGTPGAVVAERLGLAQNTVAQHLTAVRRKFGVRSSAAAAALARAHRMI